MGLIDKLKRTFVAPIVEEKEEGAAMVRSLRETGAAALDHVEALAALLKDAVPIPALEAILAVIVIVTVVFTVRLYRAESENAVSN